MISAQEFIEKLNTYVSEGKITSEEKDSIMFDCAYTQAYEPNVLLEVMVSIINKIENANNN